MLVQRAYKTELDLSDHQVTACKQHAGAARVGLQLGTAGQTRTLQSEQEEPYRHRAAPSNAGR